ALDPVDQVEPHRNQPAGRGNRRRLLKRVGSIRRLGRTNSPTGPLPPIEYRLASSIGVHAVAPSALSAVNSVETDRRREYPGFRTHSPCRFSEADMLRPCLALLLTLA